MLCLAPILLSLFLALFVVPPAVADESLTYDAASPSVNMTYDALGRVLSKGAGGASAAYAYDADYSGTITNVTYGNTTYSYEYDERMRVAKETRVIDGIAFVKEYYYDSAGRLVKQSLSPGGDIDSFYSKQGGVEKIPSYVNDTSYSAFGKPTLRAYHRLSTEMGYDNATGRLISVATAGHQNLTYGYDDAGNILSINDTANSRLHNMTYDFLNRLVETVIGDTRYSYAYTPIGNIEKIIRNGTTTKLHYGGAPVHAPSLVESLVRGADVHGERELHFANRTRVVEFWLVNEKGSAMAANWSMDFADGTIINSTEAINITGSGSVMVLAAHTYASGGTYPVNITGRGDAGTSDEETLLSSFGVSPASLAAPYRNITRTLFEFIVGNDIAETAGNISWNCSENLQSTVPFNLSGNQTVMVLIEHNYSSPGERDFSCTANSTDGSGTLSTEVSAGGLSLSNYSHAAADERTHVFGFTILNSYHPLEANWTLATDGQVFSGLVNLSAGATHTVQQQVNYSSDGQKNATVMVSAAGTSDSHGASLVSRAVEIEDHSSWNISSIVRLLEYRIWNRWPAVQSVGWNLTEPAVTGSQAANLTEGESLFVFIEENYTSGGMKRPVLRAWSAVSEDSLADRFAVWPLEIAEFLVLAEGKAGSVIEAVARSNLGTQAVGWLLDTGEANITSSQAATLNQSNTLFVIIETNYTSAGAFALNMTVNSSSQADSSGGVVAAR